MDKKFNHIDRTYTQTRVGYPDLVLIEFSDPGMPYCWMYEAADGSARGIALTSSMLDVVQYQVHGHNRATSEPRYE